MLIRQIIALCLGVVLVVGFAVINALSGPRQMRIEPNFQKVSSLPQNATYVIDESQFELLEGESVKKPLYSTESTETVTLYGEPAYGDIDGDGDDDALVILTYQSGGSGTFYYGALAWYERGTYTGTDTVLLGDRIAVDTYEIRGGIGHIEYRTYREDETFVDEPTLSQAIKVELNSDLGRIRVLGD